MFYDNFLRLCNQKGVSPSAAVVEMGFQKSVVTRWKKSIPTDANKLKIANYFGVSVDYLLGNGKKEKPVTDSDGFTEDERRDIALEVERMIADLENQGDLMFDGDPATPEALQTIRTAFEIGLTNARRINKEKHLKKE